MTRRDYTVAATLGGVSLIAGGVALAWAPGGLLVLGAALVWFGQRGGV